MTEDDFVMSCMRDGFRLKCNSNGELFKVLMVDTCGGYPKYYLKSVSSSDDFTLVSTYSFIVKRFSVYLEDKETFTIDFTRDELLILSRLVHEGISNLAGDEDISEEEDTLAFMVQLKVDGAVDGKKYIG